LNVNSKVLVVDDDSRMAGVLCDILKIRGYETEIACTGEEAVEKAQTARPCCVLMDVRMPKLDGIGALKVIRSSMPNLPVLLMSAFMTDEQTKEAAKSGVFAVLRKPLDMREVFSLLARLAEENRLKSEVQAEKPAHGINETGDIMEMPERKFLRVPIDGNIMIRRIDEALPETAETAGRCRDISVAGMGFICGASLPVGATVQINLRIGEAWFVLKARIVRIASVGSEYDYGVRFLLDDAETAKMLEELALV